MSPADFLRLSVFCLWLLACDVNCENPQRGFVLHVQAGHYPLGVHNDNRDDERWIKRPVLRIPTVGYKTSNVDKSQSRNIYPAQNDHTTDSKSSQIHSHYPYPVVPELQNSNVPKTRVNHFDFGFSSGSVTRGQSAVLYNPSGNTAVTFPSEERIHQANSDSVFSTGSVQFPSRIHRARTKSKAGFSPVNADRAPVGFGPNNRKGLIYSHSSQGGPTKAIKSSLKSESQKIHVSSSRPNMRPLHTQKLHLKTRPELGGYHSAYILSNSFNHNSTNSLPKVLQPTEKTTDSIMKGHSPGSNSAGKVKTQRPYLAWRPRAYSSDVLPEPRGYAHVRHLKPGFEKTQPQASSAAGRKFLETGFPSVNHNNNNVRGGPSDRTQIPVQGKFKPFQRLPTNYDLSAHAHSSDDETALNLTTAGTTLLPSLNSTGITSTVVPLVSGETSTNSSSPMQTEGKDATLSQASNLEVQSNSSAVAGLSIDQNKSFYSFFSKLQPAGTEGQNDPSSRNGSVYGV
ncbi:uncharacterized protein LOC111655480 [Seriola lalandi dorsalis]|uniref:uncharacterized protein LOC111655480 n=1 Tax=Seriola lalandi dorsalis TaxID=1841481 RepID=UPI000C6F8994|nr:uncharacterized protein LOC111655480 [Seriola lalandi dorsalis]